MVFSFDLAVISQRERRRSKGIRRRRRDICKSQKPTREIPFELVIEILTRLPAKSLMRFKSVSKPWLSLICSQCFTNRLLKVSSSPPRLYTWLGVDNKTVVLSSSPDSDVTTMSSFVVDQDLTIPAMKGYDASQVFRGLMCFTNGSSAQIYNTCTRQLVVLPDIEESNIIAENHQSKRIMYCIGHDPVHDQYKVFCTVSRHSYEVGGSIRYMSEHWVLLLVGDVSSRYWRKIQCKFPPHFALTQGLAINGRMHYLAWARFSYPELVSFDIRSEEISMLQVPEDAFWPDVDLIEYGGRVALLDHSEIKRASVMKVWVMEDAENKGWSSSKTLELHSSEMLIVNMHLVDNMSLKVQGTTSNGEVILVPQNLYSTSTGKIVIEAQNTNLFYVFLYNLEKNHMRTVEIKETPNRYLTKLWKTWNVIGSDDIENLMYL